MSAEADLAAEGTPESSPEGVGDGSGPVRVPAARVALSTASAYPQTCVDAFRLAADLGYDGIEVMVWTDSVSQDAAALGRLAEHYGVPVLAVHAPTLLVTQRVWGREPLPKLDRACELAVSLGARTVVAHPPFRWQREYAAGFVDAVAERVDRYGVELAVENMYPWRARNREMLAYLPGWDPVPQPYRHVTLDLSHTATSGSDALEMARSLGDRLAHLHLADGQGSAKDEHLVPGRGAQPCGAVLGLLAERGWSGTIVVEVNTRRCRSREEREADLAEALAFARLHLAAPLTAVNGVELAPPPDPLYLITGGPVLAAPVSAEPVMDDPLNADPLRGDPLYGDPLDGEPLDGEPLDGGTGGRLTDPEPHEVSLAEVSLAPTELNGVDHADAELAAAELADAGLDPEEITIPDGWPSR